MIKCEVTREFTLGKFDELKNIKRKNVDTHGRLYLGDTFECDEDMAKYLTGGNSKDKVVVKILEVIPAKIEIKEEPKVEEKKPISRTRTTRTKKSIKK